MGSAEAAAKVGWAAGGAALRCWPVCTAHARSATQCLPACMPACLHWQCTSSLLPPVGAALEHCRSLSIRTHSHPQPAFHCCPPTPRQGLVEEAPLREAVEEGKKRASDAFQEAQV